MGADSFYDIEQSAFPFVLPFLKLVRLYILINPLMLKVQAALLVVI
jgi:hypothetical protein